jgi:hypothetical protein
MRISVSVNGTTKYTSSVDGAGFLSAHLNLNDRPKEKGRNGTLHVQGFETHEAETVSVSWPEFSVNEGDVIQLAVLKEGPADAPSKRRTTAGSPRNLLSNATLAKELLDLCADFETRLFALLEKAKGIEPDEEHRKFTRAVGDMAVDLGEHLLSPVYRRHPHLVPEDMKGELL